MFRISTTYSHLFNKRGGWNKRGGGAKVAKSICKRRGWDFWEKLVHNCNKRGVEGGKNLRNQLKTWRVEMCVEGGFFFKISKRLLER